MDNNQQIKAKENHIEENVCFDAFFIDESFGDQIDTKGLLLESKNIQIGSTHNWYRIDPPNGEPRPGNLRHMHGYVEKRGNLIQIFAVCDDGSGHDGCHQTRIPREFVSILQSKGFKLPKDNLIEMYVVPQYNIGSEQETKTTQMIDWNIQIGNIYVMHLPLKEAFCWACVKVVEVEKNTSNMASNITYEIGLPCCINRGRIDTQNFRLMCIPFNLHHILLESLGFVYSEGAYSKVIDDCRFLFIKQVSDYYVIDKEMSGINNQICDTKIYSLDKLQILCKQLYNLTFKTDIEEINHILIIINSLEEYLNKLTLYISKKGYCLASEVPHLFSNVPNFPMLQKDCNLILSYAMMKGLIKEDIIDMQHYAYVLCE